MSDKQSILITGASSGIGAATARALAADHRHLVLVARRRDKLLELARECIEGGCECTPIAMDCRQSEALPDLIKLCLDTCGRLDALINNAGVFHVAQHADLKSSELDAMLELNLRVPMRLASCAIPHLAKQKNAWIINISSIAANSSFTGCAAYSATKAAIECWSRILREELREQGIRVGVIAPGATATEVWGPDSAFDTSKMLQAHDVAKAVAFMLEQEAGVALDYVQITPASGAL